MGFLQNLFGSTGVKYHLQIRKLLLLQELSIAVFFSLLLPFIVSFALCSFITIELKHVKMTTVHG